MLLRDMGAYNRRRDVDNCKNEIIKLHHDGYSQVQIAKIFNCSRIVIKRIFQECNLQARPSSFYNRKYYVNDNFFDEINTEEKAYVLGFWFGDGNNYESINTIKLSITDYDILKSIRDVLEYTGPINPYNDPRCDYWKTIHTLQINSHRLSYKLSKLGCHANKTYNLLFPSDNFIYNENLVRHFIRGLLDADGCIYIRDAYGRAPKACCVEFSGSKDVMRTLKQVLHKYINIGGGIPDRDINFKRLRIGGNVQCMRLLDWLYKDVTIFLDRKYQRYIKQKKFLKENVRGWKNIEI